MAHFTTRLPDDVAAALRQQAQRRGRSRQLEIEIGCRLALVLGLIADLEADAAATDDTAEQLAADLEAFVRLAYGRRAGLLVPTRVCVHKHTAGPG